MLDPPEPMQRARRNGDGGPAFPSLNAEMTGIDSDGGERWDTEPSGGMTLRDYFVASSGVTWSDAVTVATEGGKVVRTGPEIAEMLACMRGYVADAMLAERAK